MTREDANMEQLQLENIKLDTQDICANRHQGAETSVLANTKPDKLKDRAMIFSYIQASRGYGMTLDELCVKLNRHPNEISGRITELHYEFHLIMATGRRRPTRTGSPARVYCLPEYHGATD
jgi:hypothetical protein